MDWERHFRKASRRRRQSVGFGGIMHADDLVALNDYFHRETVKTPQAAQLQSEWAKWWTTTGNPDNYFFLIPDAVWDEARNKRLAFQLANATSQAELDLVHRVATTGMTTEQIRGEPDKRDPQTGFYYVPPPPLLPPWAKYAAIGGAAFAAAVVVLSKVLKPF